MIRAAIDITPAWARDILGLDAKLGLRPGGARLLSLLGRAADRVPILSAPPAQACLRLGLPADYLYR